MLSKTSKVVEFLEQESLAEFLKKLADLPKRMNTDDLSLLELGCGVDQNENYNIFERGYSKPIEENDCSLYAEGGWNVVGIDQHKMHQEPENWIFFQRDITKKKSLHGLPHSPFDIVRAQNFISFHDQYSISPGLVLKNGNSPFYSTHLRTSIENKSDFNDFDRAYIGFLRDFIKQVALVLKKSGLFIVNDDVLLKTEEGFEVLQKTRKSILDIIELTL